jgi:hypothetical protein
MKMDCKKCVEKCEDCKKCVDKLEDCKKCVEKCEKSTQPFLSESLEKAERCR